MSERNNGGVILTASTPATAPAVLPKGHARQFAASLFQAIAPQIVVAHATPGIVGAPTYAACVSECIKASAALFGALPDLEL